MSKEFDEWCKKQNIEMSQGGHITRINDMDLKDDVELVKISFTSGQRNPTVENIKSAFEKLTPEERSDIMEKYLPAIPLM